MALVRRNILHDENSLKKYIAGVDLLKKEKTGRTTNSFGIPGPENPVHTYDLFVIWHIQAGTYPIPKNGDPLLRNYAHRGPVFLPWHRLMLILVERNIQRILGDDSFALPYWDWSVDGDDGSPTDAPIWTSDYMGGQGNPVSDGPFGFFPNGPSNFTVRLESGPDGRPAQAGNGQGRGLIREFARSWPEGWETLPTSADVKAALDYAPDLPNPKPEDRYDVVDFSVNSDGFRGRLEGWQPATRPWTHNQVHMWTGGDMLPLSSPNDPVFFLHHCNVDRTWESWMRRYGRIYTPDMTAPATYAGERIGDTLALPANYAFTPGNMLDQSSWCTYDQLP
ncbi:tyrosinase family protein [Streptomyces sp. NPDC087787]|uniref:tyrosinase family protein n=1 Tax=Streptomyces sp. NPDC087787 TaxID=3365803 RepID=UPI003801D290